MRFLSVICFALVCACVYGAAYNPRLWHQYQQQSRNQQAWNRQNPGTFQQPSRPYVDFTAADAIDRPYTNPGVQNQHRRGTYIAPYHNLDQNVYGVRGQYESDSLQVNGGAYFGYPSGQHPTYGFDLGGSAQIGPVTVGGSGYINGQVGEWPDYDWGFNVRPNGNRKRRSVDRRKRGPACLNSCFRVCRRSSADCMANCMENACSYPTGDSMVSISRI